MSVYEYEQWREEGCAVSGGINDFSKRVGVYTDLYQDSRERNIFPLIAAHGAVWGEQFLKVAILAGRILSLNSIFNNEERARKLSTLNQFVIEFKEINRKVCAEAYALYHYSKNHKEPCDHSSLSELLCACHYENDFTDENKRALFYELFVWEQEQVVNPLIKSAYAMLDWPMIHRLSLSPRVHFSYFRNRSLKFENFACQNERIEKGLEAYALAEKVGFSYVERSLKRDQFGFYRRAIFGNQTDYRYAQ